MRILVVTNCTNRKRILNTKTVAARDLKTGTVKQVTRDWVEELKKQSKVNTAEETYCGRSFSEAILTKKILGASFYIVSAGLGLIDSQTFIPRYNATISTDSEDCILRKIEFGTPHLWWDELSEKSPFSTNLNTAEFDLILIGLASSYLNLLQPSLEVLPLIERKKLRIFNRLKNNNFSENLKKFLMPYDERFDGPKSPNAGTQGDFPQRAMRHFAEIILEKNKYGSYKEHSMLVESHLQKLKAPKKIIRQRSSDEDIIKHIKKHWNEVGGVSSRMLRFIRDDLQIACEQKRFQTLFNQTKKNIRI